MPVPSRVVLLFLSILMTSVSAAVGNRYVDQPDADVPGTPNELSIRGGRRCESPDSFSAIFPEERFNRSVFLLSREFPNLNQENTEMKKSAGIGMSAQVATKSKYPGHDSNV